MEQSLQAIQYPPFQIGHNMNKAVCHSYDRVGVRLSGSKRLMPVVLATVVVLLNALLGQTAHAVPSFARQTGQSCVACHAGGQFPELTAYGRLFKLTGYTIGERGNPLAAMVVASQTRTRNNTDSSTGGALSATDGLPIIEFGSIFVAGKLTDNIGGFAQFTYNPYDAQNANGTYYGHFGADNIDIRYADRRINERNDLIWGLTMHNNPTVQDVWNSTPAWGYPYVGGGLPVSTLIEGGLAQQVAGVGGYAYWNKSIYAELTSYQTAKGSLGFMSLGNKVGDTNGHALTHLDGNALYWRLAFTKDWDAHNIMVGAFGMDTKVLPLDANNLPISGAGNTKYRDTGFDAQYQYLLAPHTVTAHLRWVQEKIDDPNGHVYTDGPATLNSSMAKVSYVYRATYGASLAYASVTGSADTGGVYSSSALNVPNSEMWTPEFFWMPLQNLRVGVQFNYFTKYMGASSNYDGNGRNASDNNVTYIYLWTSF
jgi:hypothetical protein